jgi:trigger factor
MKVTQEKLPSSQIGLEIEITPEMSKNAYEKVIQQFTRSANIPGFRKGKVPRQMLVQRIGQRNLKAAALEDLIKDSIRKAVADEKIQVIGEFELRSQFDDLVNNFEAGQPLTFAAAVDVVPEIALADYKGLQVKAEEVKFDENEVNKTLERYRSEKATLIPIEDQPAKEGDMALVDFQGRFAYAPEGEEPQEIPGGSAKDFQVELTEGQFIPGFIEGVMGMKPGETKEISVQFPTEYGSEELAGKAAVFTITLKELKGKELPELTDDFAQEVSDFDTLAELRESLETRYKGDVERRTNANKEEALLKALVKLVEVELPATMINQEIDYLLTQQAMQLSNYGVDIRQFFTSETIPVMRERSRPDAIGRIKESLGIREVAKRESLSVSEDELQEEMKKVRQQLDKNTEVDPDRLREVVQADLVKQKTVKWLEENGTVELVPEGTLNPPAEEEGEGEDEGEGEAQGESQGEGQE